MIGVHRREVEAPGITGIVPVEEFADAARDADAIVLALPGTEQTEKILGREVLASVKPGVDDRQRRARDDRRRAGAHRCAAGRTRGARGPGCHLSSSRCRQDSPLWTLPNVLLAPHTAAISAHEPRLIAELFADNARRFLDGEPLRNVVNTREFY